MTSTLKDGAASLEERVEAKQPHDDVLTLIVVKLEHQQTDQHGHCTQCSHQNQTNKWACLAERLLRTVAGTAAVLLVVDRLWCLGLCVGKPYRCGGITIPRTLTRARIAWYCCWSAHILCLLSYTVEPSSLLRIVYVTVLFRVVQFRLVTPVSALRIPVPTWGYSTDITTISFQNGTSVFSTNCVFKTNHLFFISTLLVHYCVRASDFQQCWY